MEADVTGTDGTSISPANIDAIVQAFYDVYPAEFDMISIWTTFPDAANGGAYFMGNPGSFPAQQLGFINMNAVGFWTGFEALNTLGQEFGHAWLFYDAYIDPTTGMFSNELIGRMGAHWSSLVDTEGSVVDGVDWVDNQDGSFTVAGIMNKFGPVDLWHMGYISAEEVEPFFLLRNEMPPVGPEGIWTGLGVGSTVTATRVDLTIDDIIGAIGPQPPIDMRQKDFRMACIVVAAPGETAAGVMGAVNEVDNIRLMWNDIWVEWTWGRGTMCTDVSAPCDIPHARFAGGRVQEGAESDGDGVVEPGEHADVEVDWRNTGTSTTQGAVASLAVFDPALVAPTDVPIPDIPVGAVRTSVFDLVVPDALACGEEYLFTARATMGARQWEGSFSMIPGVMEGPVEAFATDAGWRANLDMMDTATSGAWDYGPAEATSNMSYQLQPAGGHGGPTDSAWWTGREAGFDYKANDIDMGLSRLTSAPYSLAGMLEPKLRYYVWYQAWNFNFTPAIPVTEGDDLVVEASDDGGASWVEVDRVTGQARVWERRDVPLAGKVSGDSVLFRFTAQDNPPEQNVTEVGIDDVQLYSLSKSCAGSSCGCRTGGSDGPAPLAGACALLGLALLAVRRRRC